MRERTPARVAKIQKLVDGRQQGIVVLEDISDPHNAAAVLRSCDAFGFHKVFFIFHEEKRFNPAKIGKLSSASGNKWLEFEIFSSTAECFARLKELGFTTVATALTDKSESIFEIDLSEPKIALLFGNEHRGLSEEALQLSDKTLLIPMRGMVQSLNLSVTAAICLFETTRQRNSQPSSRYDYPAEEKQRMFDELSEK
jgi:tRNA (guanosine-2'-O-)-methyltransferase